MNLLDSVILGMIEGITEFLPISSTGHLILASAVLKLQQTGFLKSFEIAIQVGAILAVVVLYWRALLVNVGILKRVILAFLPTAFLGLIFYRFVKQFLLGNTMVVLWALLLGGIFLIGFEWVRRNKRREETGEDLSLIPYRQCLVIGLFQSVAMIPGVSRSAATIIGGMCLGLRRKAIVEFSFLLAVPTMLAATGLDLLKSAPHFSTDEFYFLGVGFLVSFIAAILSIRFLLSFIKTHTFIPFGLYRIVLAVLFWAMQ
jgi:undecaprenyl-diphosphatase